MAADCSKKVATCCSPDRIVLRLLGARRRAWWTWAPSDAQSAVKGCVPMAGARSSVGTMVLQGRNPSAAPRSPAVVSSGWCACAAMRGVDRGTGCANQARDRTGTCWAVTVRTRCDADRACQLCEPAALGACAALADLNSRRSLQSLGSDKLCQTDADARLTRLTRGYETFATQSQSCPPD